MNQNQKLLSMFANGQDITRLTAMHYGIQNLTARIADLRNMGWQVDCVEKRDQEGQRYGSFSLHPSERALAASVAASRDHARPADSQLFPLAA